MDIVRFFFYLLKVKVGHMGVHQWNIKLITLLKTKHVRYQSTKHNFWQTQGTDEFLDIAAHANRNNQLLSCNLDHQTCHFAFVS